jgi:hypothetical protein
MKRRIGSLTSGVGLTGSNAGRGEQRLKDSHDSGCHHEGDRGRDSGCPADNEAGNVVTE